MYKIIYFQTTMLRKRLSHQSEKIFQRNDTRVRFYPRNYTRNNSRQEVTMQMHYINTGFHSGEWNMAFDVFLTTQLQKNNSSYIALLRLVAICALLQDNQNDILSIRKMQKRKRDVRRPTGGRAIYHSEEMTYNIVGFIRKNISALHSKVVLRWLKV